MKKKTQDYHQALCCAYCFYEVVRSIRRLSEVSTCKKKKICADLHSGPETLDNPKINGFIFLQTPLFITSNMVGIGFIL